MANFYPRPPRGGRLWLPRGVGRVSHISIHALREEGDISKVCLMHLIENFYPRPPRGGRLYPYEWSCATHLFLSTPSARRATVSPLPDVPLSALFLSTPSARRATPFCSVAASSTKFLSTPSARRATRCSTNAKGGAAISIHALREEGDDLRPIIIRGLRDFYPRPPRGGRLEALDAVELLFDISIHALREEGDVGCTILELLIFGFLSTPSARRATPP